MTVLTIVLLFTPAALLFGLGQFLLFCYNFWRASRSKEEDDHSLDEVLVDHQHHGGNNRRVLISNMAMMKHLHPSCRTDREAEIFSERRNTLNETKINTVIKAQEKDFHLDLSGTCISSNYPVPFWHCEKLDNGDFQVLLFRFWFLVEIILLFR